MKNPTSQEHQGSVEQSLEKFKELRRDLGPDATVDQKRYLDEMIFLGERRWGLRRNTIEWLRNQCRRSH
jgi:hypothetical protein